MGELVLIYGRSGTGKSSSLRNFNADEVAVVNVEGKRLPFKSELKPLNSCDYMEIEKAMKATKKKAIVIDDATYLMTEEFMKNIGKPGFQKFNEMAGNFHGLIQTARELPEDKIVYLMGHSDHSDDGMEHFKTVGKAVDNYINVEGLCTVVLKTCVQGGEYKFQTQNSGMDTCKSPSGMFPDTYIDNDLKAVDTMIRDFYGMNPITNKEDTTK